MKTCWIHASGIVLALAAAARAQTTTIASWAPVQADSYSNGESISSDGRFLAFASNASNLVPGDTNGGADIFVREIATGILERASVTSTGAQSHGLYEYSALSSDGRFVAWDGNSSDLVPGVTSTFRQVFLRDRLNGTTEVVSLATGGALGNSDSYSPSISGDGRYVAYWSAASNLVAGDTNATNDIFVRDRQLGTTERVSVATGGGQANGMSLNPAISGDGRWVVFSSDASNLVFGDANGVRDVYMHDRQTGVTQRVSIGLGGADSNNGSYSPVDVSADGRYVCFHSSASNLVANDVNGTTDVFLRDMQAGTTELVSIGAGGQGNDASYASEMTPDARYVVFASFASDFVAGDTNNQLDVFVRDRTAGTTVRASVATNGAQGDGQSSFYPRISADGRYVVFYSSATTLVPNDTNGQQDMFLRDLAAGRTTRVSLAVGSGNSYSQQPAISGDGRIVAFSSNSSNLDPNDTNGFLDVFVLDPLAGVPLRASASTSGGNANGPSDTPSISSDGRYVAFRSEASNLVSGDVNGQRDAFVRDRQNGVTELVSQATGGAQANDTTYDVAISPGGRYVAFSSGATNLVAGDTNGIMDVFVRDRTLATTERASVATGGAQGNLSSYACSISADGRYVGFHSDATTLVTGDTNGSRDVFVHDRQAATTVRVSVATDGTQGNSDSYGPPSFSADGRYVAFASDATNLVAGDTNGSTDVFVRDLVAGTTERASVGSGGTQASGGGYQPWISSDGRFVAFTSSSPDLVAGDTNGHGDVFVHDRQTNRTERVSLTSGGGQSNGDSGPSAMSIDGRYVVFASYASNLVASDTNVIEDIFVRDRGAASAFTPFCFGDGTGAACPCANSGAAGHGCENSSTTGGAVLAGSGVASLAADTAHLTTSGEKPTATSVLLQGGATANSIHYGDGLRCVGGTLKRLYTHNAVGGVVTMPQGTDATISARSAASGDVIQAGTTRYYQIYYRDPSATFCPSPSGSTFNISNAIAIAWGE